MVKKKKSIPAVLTADQQKTIREIEKKQSSSMALKVDVQDKNGSLIIRNEDLKDLYYLNTFGTVDSDSALKMMLQVVNCDPEATQEKLDKSLNSISPLLAAIAPKDELEGMLAIQMVGIHNMAMTMMHKAMQTERVNIQNMSSNLATKLTRTFIAQMDALNKHRGKGQQKMTVEHVHINEGGQAIVGTVEGGGYGK